MQSFLSTMIYILMSFVLFYTYSVKAADQVTQSSIVNNQQKDSPPLLLTPNRQINEVSPESIVQIAVKQAIDCQCESVTEKEKNKPMPSLDGQYDWIRLTSDEWLKGDLISLYKDDLEFDSDELDLLILDWEKIAEIRSKGMQSVRLINGSVIEGWISMKDGVMSIKSSQQSYEFDSLQVMGIASSQVNLKDIWDAGVSLGVNVNKGNSETFDYTFTASIQRRTTTSRLKASYISNFSKNTFQETGEQSVTADSKRFTTQGDYIFTNDMFFRAVDFEYFSDTFQNVDDRYTYSIGIGYSIINENKMTWDITAGPGYQKTNFSNVSETEESNEKSAMVNLGTVFDYEINKQLDFVSDYQLKFVDKESGKALHQLKFILKIELINDFDIDLTYYLNRTEEPRSDDDGITPEKNDYRFVVSLGYTF